jgi:hypothetical protein
MVFLFKPESRGPYYDEVCIARPDSLSPVIASPRNGRGDLIRLNG